MISPIWIGPNTTVEGIAIAVNDTFRQLEQENRTKVIRDETGLNRIIMGRFPDGTYGFAISIPGVDVLDALDK